MLSIHNNSHAFSSKAVRKLDIMFPKVEQDLTVQMKADSFVVISELSTVRDLLSVCTRLLDKRDN